METIPQIIDTRNHRYLYHYMVCTYYQSSLNERYRKISISKRKKNGIHRHRLNVNIYIQAFGIFVQTGYVYMRKYKHYPKRSSGIVIIEAEHST